MAVRFSLLKLLVVLPILQTKIYSQVYRSATFHVLKHQASNATKLKELKVKNSMECLSSCLAEDGCMSVNFDAIASKEERPVCQLLKEKPDPFGRSRRKSSRFHHYFKEECPDGWRFYSESCFIFSNVTVNWHTAKRRCVELGASLVKINDQSENNFLQINSQVEVWTGLNDIVTENDFRWQDGSSLSSGYGDWLIRQPNNWKNQDCVYLDTQGKINDVSCNIRGNYRYVCEKLL